MNLTLNPVQWKAPLSLTWQKTDKS